MARTHLAIVSAPNILTLYNYTYIRLGRVSETLYHADQGWILNFTAIYMKWQRPDDMWLNDTFAKVVKNQASLRKI